MPFEELVTGCVRETSLFELSRGGQHSRRYITAGTRNMQNKMIGGRMKKEMWNTFHRVYKEKGAQNYRRMRVLDILRKVHVRFI